VEGHPQHHELQSLLLPMSLLALALLLLLLLLPLAVMWGVVGQLHLAAKCCQVVHLLQCLHLSHDPCCCCHCRCCGPLRRACCPPQTCASCAAAQGARASRPGDPCPEAAEGVVMTPPNLLCLFPVARLAYPPAAAAAG
jgi:hypothetical protein